MINVSRLTNHQGIQVAMEAGVLASKAQTPDEEQRVQELVRHAENLLGVNKETAMSINVTKFQLTISIGGDLYKEWSDVLHAKSGEAQEVDRRKIDVIDGYEIWLYVYSGEKARIVYQLHYVTVPESNPVDTSEMTYGFTDVIHASLLDADRDRTFALVIES